MKFAVLGSNSFTGRHFCDYLKGFGDEVLEISRPVFDLNRDLEDIVKIIHASKPTHIVNFIALSRVPESWLKPEDWMQTNVTAQVALHDRLRHCDFLQKYVHVSTPEVYGSTGSWITEDYGFHPTTPYAVSKAACEMSLSSFVNAYGFPVAITRSANVYGLGQTDRLIPNAIKAKRDGTKLKLEGGTSRRSFIHVHDVCVATRLVAIKGTGAYHISTPRLHSIKEVVEMVGCEYETVPARLAQDHVYALRTERIRRLGWTDTITLEQGIEEAHGHRNRLFAVS